MTFIKRGKRLTQLKLHLKVKLKMLGNQHSPMNKSLKSSLVAWKGIRTTHQVMQLCRDL